MSEVVIRKTTALQGQRGSRNRQEEQPTLCIGLAGALLTSEFINRIILNPLISTHPNPHFTYILYYETRCNIYHTAFYIVRIMDTPKDSLYVFFCFFFFHSSIF